MAKRFSAKGVAWKQMVKKYGVRDAAKWWKNSKKGSYRPSLGRFVHNGPFGGMPLSAIGVSKPGKKRGRKSGLKRSKKTGLTRYVSYPAKTISFKPRAGGSFKRKAGGRIVWAKKDGEHIIKMKSGFLSKLGVRVPANYKFRPNPDGFVDTMKSVYSVAGLTDAAPYGLGALAAWSLPVIILPRVSATLENKGFVGYASNLISATLLGGVIGLITKKWNFAAKVMVGGIMATAIRVVVDNLPRQIPVQMTFVPGTGLMGQSNLRKQIEARVTRELAKSGMLGFTAQDIRNAAAKGVTMADEDVQVAALRYEDTADNY